MKNWNIDPKTGDYIMVKGSPVNTPSLTIPAYIRLKVPRLKWLYAPDTTYGSDLNEIKKINTTNNNQVVENTMARALTPIIDDGRAIDIDVTATERTRNGISLNTKITDATGQTEELKLSSLGV